MGTNGLTTFCLPEFDVKLEKKNGAIFMFKANKVFHCAMKNQIRNQYGMNFFQKNYVLNHLKSLKGWWWWSLNQIYILITILFRMLFFFPEKSPSWLDMYVFYIGTNTIFWGRHLLNKNNNHAYEVHEIIFLFKMYMFFVMIWIDTTWIIIKYLKCLTYCFCLTYYSWSSYA